MTEPIDTGAMAAKAVADADALQQPALPALEELPLTINGLRRAYELGRYAGASDAPDADSDHKCVACTAKDIATALFAIKASLNGDNWDGDTDEGEPDPPSPLLMLCMAAEQLAVAAERQADAAERQAQTLEGIERKLWDQA